MAQAEPSNRILHVLALGLLGVPLLYWVAHETGQDFELVLVVVALPVAVLSIVWERRRIGRMHAAALPLGLRYRGSVAPPPPVEHFELLARPAFSNTKNVMEGSVGERSITLFEVTSSGLFARRGEDHRVAAFCVPGRALPRFHLLPKGTLDSFATALGGQTIDLPDHPELSDAYRLTGEDVDAVAELFEPLADALADLRGWYVEGEGDWTLVYRAGHPVDIEQLGEFLKQALGIDALLTREPRM